MTYESKKKQLKVIYDGSFESATSTSGIKEGVFFSKSDSNYYYNKKRDFMQQNYWGYQKNRSGKYQKESNRYKKDGISKVVKEDNVDKCGRKIKPKNSENTSQCVICQSVYHWANKFPDRHDDDSNKINVTLFSQEIFECYNIKFEGKTWNGAVLDSGCTHTLCDKTWLINYIDSLTDDDKVKVTKRRSDTAFKIGDRKLFNSVKLVTIPAKIDSKHINIMADIIDTELPLLWSINAMKLAKVKVDFNNDIIFWGKIDISFTESGHYLIPISCANKVYLKLIETIHQNIFY